MSFAVALPFTVRRYFMRYRVFEQSPSNQALELTATRTAFTFSMANISYPHLTLAVGSGSSACSR